MKRTFRLTDTHPDPRRDVSDEIRFHLDMRAQELIDTGMPREEALREARRQFGDVAAIEAECRDERSARARERGRREWWRGLRLDFRYALRSLRSNVGFTLAGVLTLGLGVGAAAAVFTVVDGVLLRPLPYKDPSRLAMVWLYGALSQGGGSELPLSSGLYIEARDAVKGLTPMAAFRSWPFVLSGEANVEPEQVAGLARRCHAVFDVRRAPAAWPDVHRRGSRSWRTACRRDLVRALAAPLRWCARHRRAAW